MATLTDGGFAHRLVPAANAGSRALLLLHGTGGDENDLLPLGQMIAPGAALLSPRGKVLENGMPRFFRRLAEGVFDHEDVVRRAHELADFVAATTRAHGLARPVAVGFSNGANIAAAMLLLRPEVLDGAVLIRAMVPLPDPPAADLSGRRVLILSGAMDPDRAGGAGGRTRRPAVDSRRGGGARSSTGRSRPDAGRRHAGAPLVRRRALRRRCLSA
jgi:phospholipase/carboxylesterase